MSEPLTNTHEVHVLWNDCDPAQIVFYGNYFRWMDQATYFLFKTVGLGWDQVMEKYQTVGLPLVTAHADFRSPAKFADVLAIESTVTECGEKSLTVSHTFRVGDRVTAEGYENRVWCKPHPEKQGAIVSAPIPDEVRALIGY